MRRLLMVALVLTVAASALLTAAVRAQSLPASWPMIGGSGAHDSYVADPSFSAASASSLGVKWMTNLYSAALDSPVIGYNATLAATVAYVGTERGDVLAVDVATGRIRWPANIGVNDSIRATPAVAPNGDVWVGTVFNPTMYKLNGATGAVECSLKAPYAIDSSPIIATPPGGATTVYYGTVDGPTSGPTFAINEATCGKTFAFTGYSSTAGPWASPSYAVTASGTPLIIVGTSDPDETEYAINAVTGSLVWKHSLYIYSGDHDIADFVTVSAPGVNGFADGVAYVSDKDGVEYALDLATGNTIWQFAPCASACLTRSGAALDGNTLVYGYIAGLWAVNATTGAEIWKTPLLAEDISSPAIVGSSGQELVALGDVYGYFRTFSLATGAQGYAYKTNGYITASPAQSSGLILIASSDGFLYAFGPSGANGAAPATSISSPSSNSSSGNPDGNVTIAGSSSDATGVGSVAIAVQSGGTSGLWYNASTNAWQSAPASNAATVASPGAASSTWTFALPVPVSGGTYQVFANTTDAHGIVDKGTNVNFSVLPSNNEPRLSVAQTTASPGGTFEVTGHSFKAGEQVTLAFLGSTTTVTTNATTGYVPTTTLKVPTNAPFGPATITATGLSSGYVSTLSVDVTNNWTQLGYSALRGDFEPHDLDINNEVSIGKGTILYKSWYYQPGAPVNSSPAVVNGVAYFGDDTGLFSAVTTNTGAADWSYQIASRAGIHGSPAVDGAGNVIFGADDGNLYVLSSAGALVKQIALGAGVGAPAISGSTIVVATANGSVFRIADGSWKTVWTATLGSSVSAPPAVDAANNLVVLGDAAGAIVGLNLQTGAQQWSTQTGGAVTAAAAIQNGVVYVGSGDATMYALNETTGATTWTFKADGAIASGATIEAANGGIYHLGFGSAKGTLYLLGLNGSTIYVESGNYQNSPIVGLASAAGYIFVETAGGFAGASREQGGTYLQGWTYQTGGSLATQPAVVDGAVYVGAGDGGLYAFTPHGVNPVPAAAGRGGVHAIGGGATLTMASPWTCSLVHQ